MHTSMMWTETFNLARRSCKSVLTITSQGDYVVRQQDKDFVPEDY